MTTFVLGDGKYALAQSTRSDGCPALTLRKLERPVERHEFRTDFDLVIDVETPEAAAGLLVIAQAIAFAHGIIP